MDYQVLCEYLDIDYAEPEKDEDVSKKDIF